MGSAEFEEVLADENKTNENVRCDLKFFVPFFRGIREDVASVSFSASHQS